MTDAPPPGFELMRSMDNITTSLAPIYRRLDVGPHLTLGFFVGAQHCNPRGDCHGGVWATIADLQLGLNIALMTTRVGPTVSLNLDFLGAGRPGDWVEGKARLLNETPKLAFADALFTANGKPAVRANAIFRLKWTAHKDFSKTVEGE